MSASLATLIQIPSFVPSDNLLPFASFKTCFTTKHQCYCLSASSPSFVGRWCFRVFSSAESQGETPTSTFTRKPIAVYLAERFGLSEEEVFATSNKVKALRKTRGVVKTTDLVICEKADGVISYFQDECGFDTPHIIKLISKYPTILGANVDSTLRPVMTLLLHEYGIPRDRVQNYVSQYPKMILLKADTMRSKLVKIEDKWGISRDSTGFLRALRAFGLYSDENIESKFQVLRSYGWSDSDIRTLIQKNPCSIWLSEARLKQLLGFYMNELGYNPAYMSTRAALLTTSLENRVLPRLRVLAILKENWLIKASYQLHSCLSFPDSQFLDMFVLPYEKVVPEVREAFYARY